MKGIITDEKRSSLIATVESLVPRDNIHAICLFGPKVSGYGSNVSEGDLFIVTKGPIAKAPVFLEVNEKKQSPIIIDRAALMDAAEYFHMDEAVISIFLNIYEPLLNGDFLSDVDSAYKRRIMVEKLIELQADYGDFSSNLIIPHEYFLFDKLHNMASADPDLIDTYTHIYGGDRRSENLEFALVGFRKAAASLASNGIINNKGGAVTIMRGRTKRMNALRQLYKIYPRTTGGVVKNAMHSTASILGFEYKSKPLSKLKVKDETGYMIELDRPNKLLRLEEGVIFDDPDKTVQEVAAIYGFTGAYSHEEEKKGGIINSSTQLKITGDGREAKFILKHFPELKNAKWVLLNLWSAAAKRFNMTPLSRLDREVDGVRRLRLIGIETHRIVGVVLDGRTLVSEYVAGEPLDKSVKEITSGKGADTGNIERYAQIIAMMHKAGMVYGDTKPANALVCDDGIHLIDLEQAGEGGNGAWDLAEFLYYSAKDSEDNEGLMAVAESFLAAYRGENGSRMIAKARSFRFLVPFLPFLTPNKIRVIRRALRKYSHDGPVQEQPGLSGATSRD